MKHTILRKQRKTTRAGLVRKLDKLVSQYVIQRDKQCVLCGSTTQLTAGHIFSRTHFSLRWDINNGNVWCQCWPCNYKHVRDSYPYYNWFIKKYGHQKFDELYKHWNSITKISNTELESMIIGIESLIL